MRRRRDRSIPRRMNHIRHRGLRATGLAGLVLALALDTGLGWQGRRGESGRLREGTLKVGDESPKVELVLLDGENSRPLADFRKNRPLVLIFGSFT